ncbi:MAG: NAD-dependent epimerase/dehydratase family protein [Chloroflexi bacterium]|nr:NAD-dependent epimerase/dehydratase family protein [Chloroflexota bacterium]
MTTELLVTGGSGLLGHALKEVGPLATFISSRDCDLTDLCQVRALFLNLRPKRVIHLAAKVGGIKSNAAKNADIFTINAQINTNVLSVAQELQVERLVSVLSSCAFDVQSDRPCTEDDLHKGMPFDGNLGYGYAKRMLDIQTKLLTREHGGSFSTIAPVTMYGPHDNWDLDEGHVVASVIHKCFLAKERGGPLEVWGSGRAVRQFVYVADVARLLWRVLNGDFVGPGTVILAADNGVTIRELAEKIAKVMQFNGEIVFDQSKPEGQLAKVLKSQKFSQLFPDFVFTSLEVGLKETVQGFVQFKNRAEMMA